MGAAPAEAMNSDFEELLSIFNENGVRYLIVGGHAVMLYTEPRYTKDVCPISDLGGVYFSETGHTAEPDYEAIKIKR